MTKSAVKPSPELFRNAKVGRVGFKPLMHKDGTIFDDVDYFELLGRKCIELDNANKNPVVPTDYGSYDLETVQVAKEVCKAIDNGVSKSDIQLYLSRCIDPSK